MRSSKYVLGGGLLVFWITLGVLFGHRTSGGFAAPSGVQLAAAPPPPPPAGIRQSQRLDDAREELRRLDCSVGEKV